MQTNTFHLPISKLRSLHPIFKNLSRPGATLILGKVCEILFIKRFQIIYNEGDEDSHENLYIPLYGKVRLQSKAKGILIEELGLGQILGEEALCDSKFSKRKETCFALSDSALLCIEKKVWIRAREGILDIALKKHFGKSNTEKYEGYIKDINYLDDLFRRSYMQKKKIYQLAKSPTDGKQSK